MDSIKALIAANSKRYEEFEHYLSHIEEAENKLKTKPDISIEASKAVVEGISKPILKALDRFGEYSNEHINGMPDAKVFERALIKLKEHDSNFHEDTIEQLKKTFETILRIRNTRGELSHAKLSPKEEISDSRLSHFVFYLCEAIANYMLEVFYDIDLPERQIIAYAENSEFNDELDTEIDLKGVIYSKALYEQDYILYCEKLDEYTERKKQEIEE